MSSKIFRTVRFGFVGACCAIIQLSLLFALLKMFHVSGKGGESAVNVLAFFLSAQLNFFLSQHITWADRRTTFKMRKILSWNAMILVGFVFNQLSFAFANTLVGTGLAGIFSIAVGSGVNYLTQATIIFRLPTITTEGGVTE